MPSLCISLPLMRMYAPVSFSSRFCVLPRGPMISPVKLYPGYCLCGTYRRSSCTKGLCPAGGLNNGSISSALATHSRRSVSHASNTRCSRVLILWPVDRSYRGGGLGDRSFTGGSLRAMGTGLSIAHVSASMRDLYARRRPSRHSSSSSTSSGAHLDPSRRFRFFASAMRVRSRYAASVSCVPCAAACAPLTGTSAPFTLWLVVDVVVVVVGLEASASPVASGSMRTAVDGSGSGAAFSGLLQSTAWPRASGGTTPWSSLIFAAAARALAAITAARSSIAPPPPRASRIEARRKITSRSWEQNTTAEPVPRSTQARPRRGHDAEGR